MTYKPQTDFRFFWYLRFVSLKKNSSKFLSLHETNPSVIQILFKLVVMVYCKVSKNPNRHTTDAKRLSSGCNRGHYHSNGRRSLIGGKVIFTHVKLSYIFTCLNTMFTVAANSIRHWGLYNKL